MNNNLNNLNNEYKQPIYHQSQHIPMQYMDQQQQYVQTFNHNQYGIVGQKSGSIDDSYTTSLGPYNSYSPYNAYNQNIIDNTNLLPQINYYSNQHSNKSNNSNSTYISSTTTKSTISSVASHSHSQSTQQAIAPIHYHPYSMIQRSSTPNINIIELDEMVNELSNHSNSKQNDEKKLNISHYMKKIISQNDNNSNNNNMKHLRQNSRNVELKNFGGDIRAYNTWIACIQNNNNDKIFFYTLYPKLCEYFIDIVKTQRYPTQNDLRNIFIRHGAIANKYKNDNNTYLSIDRIHFISFWKWFKQCCQIIKELRFLWINNIVSNNNNNNNNNNIIKSEKRETKTKTKIKTKPKQLQEFMNCIGFIFLDYLDKETMSKLIRTKLFKFNNNNKQLITNKQRLITYTSINDITYRINKFNNKLNTLSILKLYKMKNKKKKKLNLSTKQYLCYIICYALKLLPNQKQKQKQQQQMENNIVNINNINMHNCSEKFIKTKFKQFNIWTATNINDLNEAYMIEFGEYNNNNNTINGQSYLNYLNDFILDETILSKANIKSMHCAYLKFVKNYELHSFLWLFVELKTKHLDAKDQCKQFMVWTGQCE